MTRTQRPLALVTGGSAGLGLALVTSLHDRGWTVVTDGRDATRLTEATRDLDNVEAVPGDIADPDHRAELVDAVRRLGRPDAPSGGLDLLVHNASTLGPLPMPRLADLTTESLAAIWDTNAGAPHSLTRSLVDHLVASDGILLSLSSDAAVQHYPGWGGYGAAKAALDHLTLTFGEETGVTAYAVDPGDMDTQLHRDAEPEEDLSHLPKADEVVPHLLALIDQRPASGRYRAADFSPTTPHQLAGDIA